jgi:hypothetical protein
MCVIDFISLEKRRHAERRAVRIDHNSQDLFFPDPLGMGDLLKLARIPPPRARFCCDSACFSASESAFRQVVAKHDGVFGADKFLKFLQYALRASETPILRRSGRQGRRALGGVFRSDSVAHSSPPSFDIYAGAALSRGGAPEMSQAMSKLASTISTGEHGYTNCRCFSLQNVGVLSGRTASHFCGGCFGLPSEIDNLLNGTL